MGSTFRWGQAPWIIDFHPDPCPLPEEVDFAVVGGGFTGLAAAAWLRRLDPQKTVAVFEAETIGAGSSGHRRSSDSDSANVFARERAC